MSGNPIITPHVKYDRFLLVRKPSKGTNHFIPRGFRDSINHSEGSDMRNLTTEQIVNKISHDVEMSKVSKEPLRNSSLKFMVKPSSEFDQAFASNNKHIKEQLHHHNNFRMDGEVNMRPFVRIKKLDRSRDLRISVHNNSPLTRTAADARDKYMFQQSHQRIATLKDRYFLTSNGTDHGGHMQSAGDKYMRKMSLGLGKRSGVYHRNPQIRLEI